VYAKAIFGPFFADLGVLAAQNGPKLPKSAIFADFRHFRPPPSKGFGRGFDKIVKIGDFGLSICWISQLQHIVISQLLVISHELVKKRLKHLQSTG